MKHKPLHKKSDKDALYSALAKHAKEMGSLSLLQLHSADSQRESALCWKLGPLQLDMSLQRLNSQTLGLLARLAELEAVGAEIHKLFSRDSISASKPGGHWLLRQHKDAPQFQNEIDEIRLEISRMSKLASEINTGQWRGSTGLSITNIVYLASGGPSTVAQFTHHALWRNSNSIKVDFASTLDGMQLYRLFSELPPQRTLFIFASKSFATVDTHANFQLARDWLIERLGQGSDLSKHFIGISSSPDRMTEAGIPQENQLRVWDWVGGRFSSCSAFSFPVLLTKGASFYRKMLKGAETVDHHFRTARLEENIPVLMALVDVWNRNFLSIQNRILLPYDSRLNLLPRFASQLELESCGKSSSAESEKLRTAGMVLGESGLDARHSLHEYIHNGSDSCCCEFILSKAPPTLASEKFQRQINSRHETCNKLCYATAKQFAFEDTREQSSRRIPGTPSTIIALDNIDPESLGALIALYEHRTFVQSVLWKVDPFNQKAVDRDKMMSSRVYNEITHD